MDKLKEKVEEQLNKLAETGITKENVDTIYKLVDIHKDIENEEYWKKKGEMMDMRYRGDEEYGNYMRGDYSGGRSRDGMGRYTRGRRYRGEDTIDEMHDHYMRYSESKESGRGSYGHESTTMKSLEYMLESVVEFLEMLKRDAGSEEEMELIREYGRKIGNM